MKINIRCFISTWMFLLVTGGAFYGFSQEIDPAIYSVLRNRHIGPPAFNKLLAENNIAGLVVPEIK